MELIFVFGNIGLRNSPGGGGGGGRVSNVSSQTKVSYRQRVQINRFIWEREREREYPNPHFVFPLMRRRSVVDGNPNHIHDKTAYLSFYKVPSYFIHSLMMWWCGSRLYFFSINGLMRASTVYISLVIMYYIFQAQCLRYNTSMQKSLKLVGNDGGYNFLMAASPLTSHMHARLQ